MVLEVSLQKYITMEDEHLINSANYIVRDKVN